MKSYILYNNKKIYIEENNGNLSFFIILNNQKNYISKNAISIILSSFFNDKEDIIFHKNEHKITKNIYDGNYHFYDNDKEDYKIFFIYNLKSDVMFKKVEKYNKLKKNTIYGKFCKLVIEPAKIITISTALALSIFHLTGGNFNDVKNLFDKVFNITDDKTDQYINFNLKKIKDKSNLTDNQAIILNEDLFKALSKTGMTKSYSKELKEKLHGIQVIEMPGIPVAGFYDKDFPSNIQTIDKNSISIISHEFIHLLQSDFKYSYLMEASAELISQEFIIENNYEIMMNNEDHEYIDYIDRVKRLCVLMEIIGPRSVWDLNFSGSDKNFKKDINKYLDKDQADKLLSIFATRKTDLSNFDMEEMQKFNEEIDKYLGIMYFNKTGKNIKDDEIISKIYKCYNSNYNMVSYRRYFHDIDENHPDFIYKDNENFDIDKLIDDNQITIIKTTISKEEEISREEYLKHCNENDKTHKYYPLCYFNGTSTHEYYDDNNSLKYIENGFDKTRLSIDQINDIIKNNPNNNKIIFDKFCKKDIHEFNEYIEENKIFSEKDADLIQYDYYFNSDDKKQIYTATINKGEKICGTMISKYDNITIDFNELYKNKPKEKAQ